MYRVAYKLIAVRGNWYTIGGLTWDQAERRVKDMQGRGFYATIEYNDGSPLQ